MATFPSESKCLFGLAQKSIGRGTEPSTHSSQTPRLLEAVAAEVEEAEGEAETSQCRQANCRHYRYHRRRRMLIALKPRPKPHSVRDM